MFWRENFVPDSIQSHYNKFPSRGYPDLQIYSEVFWVHRQVFPVPARFEHGTPDLPDQWTISCQQNKPNVEAQIKNNDSKIAVFLLSSSKSLSTYMQPRVGRKKTNLSFSNEAKAIGWFILFICDFFIRNSILCHTPYVILTTTL